MKNYNKLKFEILMRNSKLLQPLLNIIELHFYEQFKTSKKKCKIKHKRIKHILLHWKCQDIEIQTLKKGLLNCFVSLTIFLRFFCQQTLVCGKCNNKKQPHNISL